MHPLIQRAAYTLALLGALAALPVHAHDTLKLDAPKPNLAPTPPMGWSSWNKFACNVNEKLIREQADAMSPPA
jgi:alpha-galactosidase